MIVKHMMFFRIFMKRPVRYMGRIWEWIISIRKYCQLSWLKSRVWLLTSGLRISRLLMLIIWRTFNRRLLFQSRPRRKSRGWSLAKVPKMTILLFLLLLQASQYHSSNQSIIHSRKHLSHYNSLPQIHTITFSLSGDTNHNKSQTSSKITKTNKIITLSKIMHTKEPQTMF